MVHILRQINPVHTTPLYLRYILILSSHLRLGLPSGVLLDFLKIFYMHSSSFHIRATCHARRILLDLVTVIILVEDYKL
jgi:hypothetical protein